MLAKQASTSDTEFLNRAKREDRLMTIEYAALFIGVFLVVLILIWKRLHAMDTQLRKMRSEIDQLQTIESRLFFMALNSNAKRIAPKTANHAPAESNVGDVAVRARPVPGAQRPD
jgi:hypothetical protein